jgi:misacylated tRNA(Ala) deacylase
MKATERLYLLDDDLLENRAEITAINGDLFAVDRSCFYPGGGGQPADEGRVVLASGESHDIAGAHADENGVVWHKLREGSADGWLGQAVTLAVQGERRKVLSRYHTVLHILNTLALRDYDAWMTGAQIGTDYSRIDFKIEGFSKELAAELETKVNVVIAGKHSIRSSELTEAEFNQRDDLLRTLKVRPPVVNGHVRVVEIQGFDTQACGGTHVHDTGEIGRFSIFKIENNGRINKRFYVRLAAGNAAPA